MVLTTGAAGAAETPAPESPLAFADPATLSTSCAKLAEEGAEVPIRNETAVEQEVHVDLVLTEKEDEAEGPCRVRLLEPLPKSLAPGQEIVLNLTRTGGPAAGALSGAIVLYGSQGRVARKEIEIADAKVPALELAAVPLVSSVSADLDASEDGPIWVPVKAEEEEPAKGEDEPAEDGQAAAITVGALSGPGDPVAVVFHGGAGSAVGSSEASKLRLDLEGDLSPGTYSGEVDLAPDDKDKGDVTVTVEVSRSWALAAFLILVGIGIGVLLLRANGRSLPAARLGGRVGALSTRYEKALASLTEGTDASKPWRGFRIVDLAERQAALRTQISEAKDKVLVKIDETAVTNIGVAIDGLEAQIDLLKEVPRYAQGVENALQLQRPVQLPELGKEGERDRPKLEVEVAATIEGKGLKAAELKPRLDEMESGAKQVRDLRKLEMELERLWLARNLLKSEGADTRRLDVLLTDCRRTLWTLSGAAELMEAGEDIEEAREALVDLRGTHAAAPRSLVDQAYVKIEEGSGFSLASVSPMPMTVVEPAPGADPVPQLPAPPLDKAAVDAALDKALWAQTWVVVVSALVALATGLGLLYADKAWGTPWDLLAALTWGIVAQATVSTLVSNLDGFGALRWLRRG